MPRYWLMLLFLMSTYSQVVFGCFQERRVSLVEAEELGFKFQVAEEKSNSGKIKVTVNYPDSIYSYIPKGAKFKIVPKPEFIKNSEIAENTVEGRPILEQEFSKKEIESLQVGMFYSLPEHGTQMYIIISGFSGRLP